MDANHAFSGVVRQRTPCSLRKIKVGFATPFTGVCNSCINDIALAADAFVAFRSSVGYLDEMATEIVFTKMVPPVVAESNELISVGVDVSAGTCYTILVVNGRFAVVP